MPLSIEGLDSVTPTYVIGYGGTGSRIAARLRRLVMDNPALRDYDDRLFCFGGLDTNQGDLDDPFLKKHLKHRISITQGLQSIAHYVGDESSREGQARLREFDGWIELTSYRKFHDFQRGAGQERALSRAAWHIGMRSGKLGPEIDRLLDVLGGERAAGAGNLAEGLGRLPKVYIVASISGGTGAGGSMYFGRHVSRYLDGRFGGAHVTIVGVLLLPDIFCGSPQDPTLYDSLRANGYAYFKELEAIYKRRGFTTPETARRAGLEPFELGDGLPENLAPFDQTFLVGADNPFVSRLRSERGYEAYERMVAQALYARIFSRELNNKTYGAENNLLGQLGRGAGRADQSTKRFCSLGSAVLAYAKDDAVEYLGSRLLADRLIGEEWAAFDRDFENARRAYLDRLRAGDSETAPPSRVAVFSAFMETSNAPSRAREASATVRRAYKEARPSVEGRERALAKDFVRALNARLDAAFDEDTKAAVGRDPLLASFLPGFEGNPFSPIGDYLSSLEKGDPKELMAELKRLKRDWLDALQGILEQRVLPLQDLLLEEVLREEAAASRESWSPWRLGAYLKPELSFFGLRYLSGEILLGLRAGLGELQERFRKAKDDYAAVLDTDFDRRTPQRENLDEAAAKFERLGAMQRFLNQKGIKELVEEFRSYFDRRVRLLRSVYRDRVGLGLLSSLVEMLGEGVDGGGLLALHYAATDALSDRRLRILESAEALAADNPLAREQFSNLQFVYSDREAKRAQWTRVSEEYDAKPEFASACQSAFTGAFLERWRGLQALRFDRSKAAAFRAATREAQARIGGEAEEGLRAYVRASLPHFAAVDLSILDAAALEAEAKGVPPERRREHLLGLLKAAHAASAPFVQIPAAGHTFHDFLVCDVALDESLYRSFLDLVGPGSDLHTVSVARDDFFGKHLAIFSRFLLAFSIDEPRGMFNGSDNYHDAYLRNLGVDGSPHLDLRFEGLIEEPATHLEDAVREEFAAAFATKLLRRDGTGCFRRFDRFGVKGERLGGPEEASRDWSWAFAWFKAHRSDLAAELDRRRRVLADKDATLPPDRQETPRALLELAAGLEAAEGAGLSEREQAFRLGFALWLRGALGTRYANYLEERAGGGAP